MNDLSADSSSDSLRERLLACVNALKRPAKPAALADRLRLKQPDRERMNALLVELESAGLAARNARGDVGPPRSMGLFVGSIRFSPRSRTARLVNEDTGETIALVNERRASSALHRDRVLAREFHTAPGRMLRRGWIPEARVVRILKRAREDVTGIVRVEGRDTFVEVDEPGFVHRVSLAGEEHPPAGERVRVRLGNWPSASAPLPGAIVEQFGPAGTRDADRNALTSRYGLKDDFPPEALAEAGELAESLSIEETAARTDFRDQPVVTIDPEDARDHDDAIHAQARGSGWRIWVHIADVSRCVRPGGAIDAEAMQRGTSVYLPDRVIPMLPERLSTDLCSLLPDTERPVLTAEMDITADGGIEAARFHRGLIRVVRKLSYPEAFILLENNRDELLATASQAADALRRRRFAQGALDLDFPEVKVRVDAGGTPLRVERVAHDRSHRLVEEFMLAANDAVAAALKGAQRAALYRIHEAPDPERLMELQETAEGLGLNPGNLNSPGGLQRYLQVIRGREDEPALKLALLRSLRLAVYHSEPLGHYGLAKANYTHFTSPIRRYPDLVVHRALVQWLGWSPPAPLAPVSLQAVASLASERERAAADAERHAVRALQIELAAGLVNTVQDALVLDVLPKGLKLEIEALSLECFLPVWELHRTGYILRGGTKVLEPRARRGPTIRPGARIRVRILEADVVRANVRIGLET